MSRMQCEIVSSRLPLMSLSVSKKEALSSNNLCDTKSSSKSLN